MFAPSAIAMVSFRTTWTRSMSMGERLRFAKAVTRIRVPSSSRMFEEIRVAMYSITSSGISIRSIAAFLRKIATRVSNSGAWMSVIRPHSKRESIRSSKPSNCLGLRSEVITTCLLWSWRVLKV